MNDQKIKDIKAMPFEEAFAALQDNVAQLEGQNLPLEKALKLYETGQYLARHCAELLEKAEMRVQQLSNLTQLPPETDV
jgi:exodeoxyribonuclease VII small subunit